MSKQEKKEKTKLAKIDALDRQIALLECVRCDLNESKTLEEAKYRLDEVLMIITMTKKLQEGNADSFVEDVKSLSKTDKEKAAYLAVHGCLELNPKAGLD